MDFSLGYRNDIKIIYSESILAGERTVLDRITQLTAGEDGEDFAYFPTDSPEVNNQKYALRELRQEWGANTGFK